MSSSQDATLSDADMRHDDDLENQLVELVSALEQLLTEADEKQGGPKRAIFALQACREMIRRLLKFSDGRFPPEMLEEVDTRTAAVFEGANRLERNLSRLTNSMLQDLFVKQTIDAEGYRHAYREIGRELQKVMSMYARMVLSLFRYPDKQQQWRDVFDTFLEELEPRWYEPVR